MKNISSNKKLVCTIVSHTPYAMGRNGTLVGLGPTVEEIDQLANLFSKVYHCAPIYDSGALPSYIRHKNNNVMVLPLKPAGGDSLFEKLNHILQFPFNLMQIKSCLKKSEFFHFRAPTGIGVLLLPLVILFWKKNAWIKYAGTWEDNSVPLSYKFQRWFLKIAPTRFKISINSSPELYRGNIFELINPCFSKCRYMNSIKIAKQKTFDEKINLLFVGRLEEAKGLGDLMSLIKQLKEVSRINSLTVIGESKTKHLYENVSLGLPIKTIFTGPLPREEVFRYYEKSHILILLSKSEGFPKVIMESAAYGCVPIVSNIPDIKRKIKHMYNGFILESNSGEIDSKEFNKILIDKTKLKFCSTNIHKDSKAYTFENYLSQIKNAVLSNTFK